LEERLLERRHQAVSDLVGVGSRQLYVDVDHRHPDLRLLLARRHQHGEGAEQQRCDDEQWRQLGVEKGCGDATGEAGACRLLACHGSTSSGVPSGGATVRPTASASSPASPDKTSTRPSWNSLPSVTTRDAARPRASRTTTRSSPPERTIAARGTITESRAPSGSRTRPAEPVARAGASG